MNLFIRGVRNIVSVLCVIRNTFKFVIPGINRSIEAKAKPNNTFITTRPKPSNHGIVYHGLTRTPCFRFERRSSSRYLLTFHRSLLRSKVLGVVVVVVVVERARDDRTMKIGQFRGLGRTSVSVGVLEKIYSLRTGKGTERAAGRRMVSGDSFQL